MLFRDQKGNAVEIQRSSFLDDGSHAQAIARTFGVVIPCPPPHPEANPDVLAANIRLQLQRQARQGQRRERR